MPVLMEKKDRQLRHSHYSAPNKHGQSFGFDVLESEGGYWYGRFTIRRFQGDGVCTYYWSSEPFMLLARMKVQVEAFNEIAKDYRRWKRAIGAST